MTTLLEISREQFPQSIAGKIRLEIFPFLSPELRLWMSQLPESQLDSLEEIRLRINSPVLLRQKSGDFYLGKNGMPTSQWETAIYCSSENINKTVALLCHSSLYALEEELKKGFLTLPGGHRAGFVGRAVLDRGMIRTLKSISSINMRIARFIPGTALKIIKHLIIGNNLRHTLIISPPRGGKTTLLRDMIATISNGFACFSPIDVGLVDERSEIAGCREGIPQLPVGHRTDVLDGCPKAEGMMMLVRSMAPQVIATDEIGRKEDAEAIQEVINAGIKLLATVHGENKEDILRRPVIRDIVEQKVFERYVILSRKHGPGTVENIYNKNWDPLVIKGGDQWCLS